MSTSGTNVTWSRDRIPRFGVILIAAAGFLLPLAPALHAQVARDNVVLIVLDGLRWEEVFRGADSTLLNREHGGIDDTAAIRAEFWRPAVEERRRALMPFLWDSVAATGVLIGDGDAGESVRATNGLNFSYPGYNEMIAGVADSRIDSNEHPANPNLTVFDWLNRRPGFEGRVAVFGTWDAFPRIFNSEQAGLAVHAAWPDPYLPADTGVDVIVNRLARTTTRIWDDLAYDSFMQLAVRAHVVAAKPNVLFVGYGETDVWAHDGEYGKLLRSARQTDAFIAELWSLMQGMPEYRGRTTLIITTDHGRGSGLRQWRDHGKDVAGADRIWIAAIGPRVRRPHQPGAGISVTQSQIAATVAAAVGEDFRSAVPAAAAAISGIGDR